MPTNAEEQRRPISITTSSSESREQAISSFLEAVKKRTEGSVVGPDAKIDFYTSKQFKKLGGRDPEVSCFVFDYPFGDGRKADIYQMENRELIQFLRQLLENLGHKPIP